MTDHKYFDFCYREDIDDIEMVEGNCEWKSGRWINLDPDGVTIRMARNDRYVLHHFSESDFMTLESPDVYVSEVLRKMASVLRQQTSN